MSRGWCFFFHFMYDYRGAWGFLPREQPDFFLVYTEGTEYGLTSPRSKSDALSFPKKRILSKRLKSIFFNRLCSPSIYLTVHEWLTEVNGRLLIDSNFFFAMDSLCISIPFLIQLKIYSTSMMCEIITSIQKVCFYAISTNSRHWHLSDNFVIINYSFISMSMFKVSVINVPSFMCQKWYFETHLS